MAARQESNYLESSIVIYELEFEINVLDVVFYETLVTNKKYKSVLSVCNTNSKQQFEWYAHCM